MRTRQNAARIRWLALLLAFSAAWAGSGEDEVAHAVVQGMKDAAAALERGDPIEAERIYRRLIELQPGYADAHGGLARALEAQGRLNEPLGILLGLGQSLLDAGNTAEGLVYLAQAERLAPASPAAQAALGRALLLSDKHEQSITHLRRAISLGESSDASWLLLGAALWETGRMDESQAAYRELLRRDGNSLLGLQALGSLLLWQGRYGEAAPLLERAVARAPASISLRLDLARACEGAGDDERAIAFYREVLQASPDRFRARYNLALLLSRRGDRAAALRQIELFHEGQASAQQRTHEQTRDEAHTEFGWQMIRDRRFAEAAALFREMGDDVAALTGLAAALAGSGDHEGAARALTRALDIEPFRPDLRLRLAEEQAAWSAQR